LNFLNDHYRYFLMAPMALGATVDDAHEAVAVVSASLWPLRGSRPRHPRTPGGAARAHPGWLGRTGST
jgi:hypothetical protein